jgi:hypothetical protein
MYLNGRMYENNDLQTPISVGWVDYAHTPYTKAYFFSSSLPLTSSPLPLLCLRSLLYFLSATHILFSINSIYSRASLSLSLSLSCARTRTRVPRIIYLVTTTYLGRDLQFFLLFYRFFFIKNHSVFMEEKVANKHILTSYFLRILPCLFLWLACMLQIAFPPFAISPLQHLYSRNLN